MTTPTMNAPPDGRRTAEHTGSGANPFANSRWARRQIRIVSPVHASTLAAIALDSNKDGVAVCGQERIAAATRYSVRAVRMALAWLEAQGYLLMRRPPGLVAMLSDPEYGIAGHERYPPTLAQFTEATEKAEKRVLLAACGARRALGLTLSCLGSPRG